jgi:hypothetical protein
MTVVDEAAQRRWMEQWRGAALALEEHKRRELRFLTDERALAASDALLALACPERLSPERRNSSGLVEQQQQLHRRDGR